MGPQEVVIVVLLAIWYLGPIVICILKGKYWMSFFSVLVLVGILGAIGAIRLAKPGSYWYRNRYSDAKRAKADKRFATPVRDRMEANAAREKAEIKAAKEAKKSAKAE
jgi:hypothetical protein